MYERKKRKCLFFLNSGKCYEFLGPRISGNPDYWKHTNQTHIHTHNRLKYFRFSFEFTEAILKFTVKIISDAIDCLLFGIFALFAQQPPRFLSIVVMSSLAAVTHSFRHNW